MTRSTRPQTLQVIPCILQILAKLGGLRILPHQLLHDLDDLFDVTNRLAQITVLLGKQPEFGIGNEDAAPKLRVGEVQLHPLCANHQGLLVERDRYAARAVSTKANRNCGAGPPGGRQERQPTAARRLRAPRGGD